MTAPRNRVRGIAELPAARVENSPGNWRTHDAAQKNKMRGLLGEVGSVSELVVWVPDDEARAELKAHPGADGFAWWLDHFTGKVRLLDGHMRKGLRGKKLGVQITDLDAREAALVLATFDPIGAQAGRDDKLLAELLDGQRSENRGLEALLADLRASVGAPATGEEPDLDEGPAVDPTDEILAKWAALGCDGGSLWEIPSADGQRVHRVLCGDARYSDHVDRLMQGRRAKLGQHDPPYGVSIVERGVGSGKREGNSTVPRGKFRPVEGDTEVPDIAHLLKSADRVVLWGANNYPGLLPPSNHWIVWDKKATSDGGSCAEDVAFGDAELAFVSPDRASVGRIRVIRHLWSGMYRASEHGNKRLAPTQKAIAVIAKPIEWWTAPGDLVTDWYCGSGTTGLAAERIGRIAYLMEITPRYTAVTLERLTRAGLTPRRVG